MPDSAFILKPYRQWFYEVGHQSRRRRAVTADAYPAYIGCQMIFTSEGEREFARCISKLVYTNPFLPERIECERAALGEAFVAGDRVWNVLADPAREISNVAAIGQRADALARAARERLGEGAKATKDE